MEVYFPMVGQSHVRVKFNSEIMTFYVNPDKETVESLKTKIAHRIQRHIDTFCLSDTSGRIGYYLNMTLASWGIRSGDLLAVGLH